MIRKLTLVLIGLALSFGWSGCIIPKGYIDPTFRTATYKDVAPAAQPVPVRVEYVFKVNDKPAKRATEILQKKAERVLESTKVLQPDPAAKATLTIELTNYADMGQAFSKGFATGFTFGLVGSHVVDRYTMTLKYTAADAQSFSHSYDHALHSTIGLKSAPEGMTPVSYADAFDQIVEDLVLRYLVDFEQWQLEQKGKVAATTPPAEPAAQ
jgi:hypothetical protein